MTTQTQSTRFLIGSEVRTTDGPAGTLVRVVVEPVAAVVTHLVVDPDRKGFPPRLVPVGLVVAADPLELSCTAEEFADLDEAVEAWFVPGAQEVYGYGRGRAAAWPFYALAAGRGAGLGAATIDHARPEDPRLGGFVVRDRVPAGEVEIRRDEPVYAADGPIGHVRGLAVDRGHRAVTHILLDEGHLWGRKQVAIPIVVAECLDYGVHLLITREEVRDLPPVDVEDWS